MTALASCSFLLREGASCVRQAAAKSRNRLGVQDHPAITVGVQTKQGLPVSMAPGEGARRMLVDQLYGAKTIAQRLRLPSTCLSGHRSPPDSTWRVSCSLAFETAAVFCSECNRSLLIVVCSQHCDVVTSSGVRERHPLRLQQLGQRWRNGLVVQRCKLASLPPQPSTATLVVASSSSSLVGTIALTLPPHPPHDGA